MKLTIARAVKEYVPSLTIYFEVINTNEIFNGEKGLELSIFDECKLTVIEQKEYEMFRQKIANNELLAVERLKAISSLELLPKPDPITERVIQISYVTSMPITVFSVDKFDAMLLRFACKKESMQTKEGSFPVRNGALIAVTEIGILGVFGIKSSTLGKITAETRTIAVLSFGCSHASSKKSQKLVKLFTNELRINKQRSEVIV